MRLKDITLVFNYEDNGKEVRIEASIDAEHGWAQWMASNEQLSENVSLLEAINEAAMEKGDWIIED